MSTINDVPISYFVYSSLSYFGARRGAELPGRWFVQALKVAGRDEAAVRQTLYRMEKDGELLTRREGRMKFYRASSYAQAEIEAGSSKIFDRPPREWDGLWTVVRVGLRTTQAAEHRERVIALLAVEGFAQLDANIFVHPHQTGDRLRDALPGAAREDVLILRGESLMEESQPALVKLWRLGDLARRYRRVLASLAKIRDHTCAGVSDRQAFLMRFAVVFDYLGVAWDDPHLPEAMLPRDWPGDEARTTAAELYELLLPGAIRYGDALLAGVTGGPVDPKWRTR
jgi:phenylacetic acid degradation operon negative regulatory protein